MKASVIAGVLLVVLVGLVICHACYFGNTVNNIQNMLSALPEKPQEDTPQAVADILAYTKKHKRYLSISVCFSAVDRVLEVSQSLLIYAEIGDIMNYQITKATLYDAVQDMGRLERIRVGRDRSIEN